MIQVYPAILKKDIDGYETTKDYYLVEFPDLDGMTQGINLNDAMRMASDYLGIVLADKIESGEKLPTPSNIKDITTDENSIVTLVSVELDDYLNNIDYDSITVNIPHFLKEKADKWGINFDEVLSESLENILFSIDTIKLDDFLE